MYLILHLSRNFSEDIIFAQINKVLLVAKLVIANNTSLLSMS